MNRLHDWPERLNAFVDSRREAPFSWGVNDCCLFAADAVLAMTGEDIAAEHRGKYATDFGAARILEAGGGIAGLTKELPRRQRGFAQRGDLVIADCDGRETLGVYIGQRQWCAPGADRLAFLPMSDDFVVIAI